MRRVIIANRRDGGWWWRLPILAVIWLVLAAPLVAGGALALTLRRWARDLPAVPDLAAWRHGAPRTSYLLAADGTRLAELPFRDGVRVGHRTLVPFGRLPKVLLQAVLAAEDVHFLEHHGVDYPAIVRAAWINYQAGRVVEGASTITQQVARNLLPDEIGSSRSARRKVREALLARAIERRWSKREILEVYLDLVFLGANAYGVAAGARAYFDRDVADLTLPEAATLAGLIQAPGRLDPTHNLAGARARRDEILARMARARFIDEPTRAAAVATPLALHRPAASYRQRVPWYTEQVRALITAALPAELDHGGLVVDTAALPALGAEVEAAAAAHVARWRDPASGLEPEVGVLLWDHRTGYVEALQGGVGDPADRFDRVLHSCRQPGSAWKPVVYGAALDADAITPGTALRDAPITAYDEGTNVAWKPRSGGHFRGLVLAQDAFAASLNAPAIEVLDRVGAPRVIALARRLGVTSKIAELRPMALGASCVRPLELARVFAIIARGGAAIAPRFAVRVRRDDEALFDAAVPEDPTLAADRRLDRLAAVAGLPPDERVGAPSQGGPPLDPRTAYQLVDMMAAVTTRGTATAARGLGRPSAGKTGTTNDNTDAWFIGFTGRLLGAVWVGFDDPVHKLGHDGDGAHAALPLWLRAVGAAEGHRSPRPVPGPPPAGLERVTIDRESGLRAATGAGGLDLWFRTGTAPTESAGQAGESATDYGRATREF
jgi:penicillin-binding protein 1A